MSEELLWVERLTGTSLIVQTIELLLLRIHYSDGGIWSWKNISPEFNFFPWFIRKPLELCLHSPQFHILLVLRLLAAVTILFFPHPLLMIFLFLSTLMISIRWRGTFNGGSDFMTLTVLFALSIATGFATEAVLVKGSLWYIGLQACTSYFLAGLVKIKRPNWQKGLAIPAFVDASIYGPMPAMSKPLRNKPLLLGLTWSILIFECVFPLALINPSVCTVFIGIAFLFHLGNFYAFGLNRFVFAWIATYPALYYCSLHLN